MDQNSRDVLDGSGKRCVRHVAQSGIEGQRETRSTLSSENRQFVCCELKPAIVYYRTAGWRAPDDKR
jgi:hypothetical protein